MQKTLLKVLVKIKTITVGGITEKNGGFGMNELLGIAAAVILAAFIIIPGLRTFSTKIITGLTGWWDGSVASIVFPIN